MAKNRRLAARFIIFAVVCAATLSVLWIQLNRADSSGDWIEVTLQHLSLEEKVGQLLFVATPGTYYAEDSDEWKEIVRYATERKIGGFVFSIGDVYEYAVQLNKLQSIVEVPLLIAGDFEYGAAMRVRRSTMFPRAMAIGATRNARYAYEAGRITALEGRAIGVHQNYAPTIDVNNNPRNPVINTRSFGDDVHLVSEMGAAYTRGSQDGGMIATLKHFPGHGDTDVDTHLGLATLSHEKDHYDAIEFPPFTAAIKAGAMSVMVGHIAVPVFDTASGIPASVSPRITTDLLRKKLGFSGLIVTDALRMRGVAARYSPGEAAVLALNAGADVVLMPADIDVAIDAIITAIRRNILTEERLDESVRRILKAKQWAGLDRDRFVDVSKVASVVDTREHRARALEIARKAVTILGNKNSILPLSVVERRKFLDIVISDSEDPRAGRSFHNSLRNRLNADIARIDDRSNDLEYDSVVASARRADVLVFQFLLTVRSGEMTGFISRKQKDLVARLAALGKPMIAISFGNPYVMMELPPLEAYVCAYSDAPVMQQAVAEVAFAEEPAVGKLPITIPKFFKFGDGIQYPKTRLRVGEPEEAGFTVEGLKNVDKVIEDAIKDSAFPGATLVIARNGIIVREQGYGSFDYELYSKRVGVNSMFDLASVTKVISTTSAVMRLVGEGKLDLKDPVVKYFPKFGQHGKEHITLYNLLVHNSGLIGWAKFYESSQTPQAILDSIVASQLRYSTGDTTIYSDLGLITVGKIIEKVSGTPLDRFIDSVFFSPLGMTSTMYNPPERLWQRIMPTEVDTFWRKTGKAVRGTVHDENAAVLGGVSGHAGLFSTAPDLAVILQMLLNGGTYGGARYLKEEVIQEFTTRQNLKSSRGIGWDTKASSRSWAGRLLSEKTFLHTGFCGTSVAVDPTRNLIVVFLTNRVHPTRANVKINQVRPRLHEAIVHALKQD